MNIKFEALLDIVTTMVVTEGEECSQKEHIDEQYLYRYCEGVYTTYEVIGAMLFKKPEKELIQAFIESVKKKGASSKVLRHLTKKDN